MNEQELKKSIEKMVDDILKQKTEESVVKAMPTSPAANGGKDEIKSGSPHQEEKELEAKEEKTEKAEKKDEEEEKEPKDKKKDEKKEKSEMKKSEDKDEEEDEEKEKKAKEEKKEKKMKKSLEELSDLLDADELELIKAWREEGAEEIVKSEVAVEETPASETLSKSLAKALEDSIAPLKKSLEEKDALIKGMSEKIEKMASQPAYDRRSISTLETLEKSGSEGAREVSKTQVTDKLLEMQLAGKGVTSHHIAEFEATGNISDAVVKSMVFKELKLN